MRTQREQLLATFEEAKARGVSVLQIEADRNAHPRPTGLISDFGYEPITGETKCVALTWDPDEERRAILKANQRVHRDIRRARIAGANRIERVDRDAIIKRDNSTCHLCGKTCTPIEIHLDHVVPLARGGDHTTDNLRVACAECNLRKGAKLIAA